MSTRAYRIIKIERADYPSFNLWHDDKLIKFMQDNGEYNELLTEGGGGTIDISIETIEKVLNEYKELDEYAREAFTKDLEYANKNNDTYITYDCF